LLVSLAQADTDRYLAPVALLMVAFISWVLTKAVKAKSGIDSAIMLILLGMMVAMLAGPAWLYLTTLGFGISDVVIWEIAVFMAVGMMPISGLYVAQVIIRTEPDRSGPEPFSFLVRHTSEVRTAYIVLLVLSELFMGWTFNLAAGLIGLTAGYSAADVAKELEYSLTSYWFVFTMVGEMGFSLLALRKSLRSDLLKVLAIQAVVMFLTPTAVGSKVWETYTVYLEAAVMTGLVVFALRYLRTRTERDRPLLSYLGVFIIANAVMMVGFLVWLVDGDYLLLALSLIAETLVYFDAVLTGAGLGETFRP
jgi:hypothetical protein